MAGDDHGREPAARAMRASRGTLRRGGLTAQSESDVGHGPSVLALALMRDVMRVPPIAAMAMAVTIAAMFLVNSAGNPPGFAWDESGIAYNAWRLASTGADMNGERWPAYTTFVGGAMNMPYVYVLSAVFAVTGPGIEVARLVSGVLGLGGGVALGVFAGHLSGRPWVGVLGGAMALTSPWLFENSRLVYEVAIHPLALGLLVLATYRAGRRSWTIADMIAVAAALALVTYGYSVGRLVGPLLAAALIVFWTRRGWDAVVGTWALYGLLLIPMLLFSLSHPGWLTGRFQELTYLSATESVWTAVGELGKHYLGIFDPARLLLIGETGNHRHHVADVTGSIPLVVFILAITGVAELLRGRLSEPFSRWLLIGLVISPLPAALTNDSFHSLRLVPFFVFLSAVACYGLVAFAERAARPGMWRAGAIAVLVVGVAQAAYFMTRYHQVGTSPERHAWFDSGMPELMAAAAEAGEVVHVFDDRAPTHLHALWYATLYGIGEERLEVVDDPGSLDEGAIVLSSEESCERCEVLARDSLFMVYRRVE